MWSNAVLIAGVGFGIVFVVLGLLMMSMQLAGVVLSSKSGKKSETTK